MKLAVLTITTLLAVAFALPPDHKKVAENNGKFAFDIYAELNKEDNVFLSPFSISAALAMTYAGADGVTRDEMKKVMHFEGSDREFHQAFAELIKEIEKLNSKDVQMNIANKLFADKQFRMLDSFVQTNRDLYKAPVHEVDYRNKAEEARLSINEWVEKQTKNKIKNLIPNGVLTPLTRLVLVNAIYFYADWQNQFDSSFTRNAPFYHDDKTKDVKMMHQKLYASYTENSDVQVLTLPYKGNQVAMDIFLPKNKNGLAKFEKGLTYESYKSLLAGMRHTEVSLWMPKFKMTTDFALKQVLLKMGMQMPFSDKATFTKITKDIPVKISEVIHKAFIDVSEKGTEAAAATAVIMVETDSVSPDPVGFHADHPFFFVIRDVNSGSILFMGRVQNPE